MKASEAVGVMPAAVSQDGMAETPTVPALAGLTAEQLKECLELGATLMEIKELAMAGFGYEAIASMASLLVANRSSGGDTARMMAVLEQQAKNTEVQNERTRPRENANYVATSIFLKPNGEPWAKDLKCDIYFGPLHLNRDPLTKAEVDALNQLGPIEKGTIAKVDGSKVKVRVLPREDAIGRLERLTIELPMRHEDNPQHYPKLIDLAYQLAEQAKAAVAA
jgi:hypothetical protein